MGYERAINSVAIYRENKYSNTYFLGIFVFHKIFFLVSQQYQFSRSRKSNQESSDNVKKMPVCCINQMSIMPSNGFAA